MPIDLKKQLAELGIKEQQREVAIARREVAGTVAYKGAVLSDFTTRDIFSYSTDEKVLRAAHKALLEFGLVSPASRVSSGSLELYTRCEQQICKLTGAQSSLLFNTRNQAVLSLVSCIADERDCFVLSDELQTPFLDAAYLVDAECTLFSADRPETLKKALERTTGKRNVFVVIDVVSAYEGQTRDLKSLKVICAQHGADLILDQSCSFGFISEEKGNDPFSLNMSLEAICSLLDFSALLGSKGSALAGSAELISLLIARSVVVARELPLAPAICAGLLVILEDLAGKTASLDRLNFVTSEFVSGCTEGGFNGLKNPDIPIVNLPFSDAETAAKFTRGLFEKGILVESFGPVRQRSSKSYLQFIITVNHKQKSIEQCLEAISEVSKRL